jgi:hypothetical protein
MLPDAEGPIHAEPYALNVYSPDGEKKLDASSKLLSLQQQHILLSPPAEHYIILPATLLRA